MSRRRKRKARKVSSVPGALAWALVLLLALITVLGLLKVLSPRKASHPPSRPSRTLESSPAPRTKVPPPPSPPTSSSPPRPRLALIIDDMGQRPKLERRFLELGLYLNFAFLPWAPYTPTLAREAHKRGFTVLIHLPMEAENGENPGPGALRVYMDEEEIKRRTLEMLKRVPYAEGANQHMGSLFSQDPLRIRWVLEILHEKGFFFIDSRTTPRSIVPFVAQTLKIPFAERDFFLDNSLQDEALEESFRRMLRLVEKRGRLIVIAHPHPQTLRLLIRHRQELQSRVALVSVKKLVEVNP